MKRILTLGILLSIVLMMTAEQAMAIPAFARKYKFSCTVCHQPFPRLKPYGDDFAANGFMLEDDPATRYFQDTGDKDLRLIRDFPIAIRLDLWAMNNAATEKYADYMEPYVMKLLSGGALSDNIAYYFYFYLGEKGEVAGLDDAFLMFNNIIGGQNLDLYVGQFSMVDPLMKTELRLPFENYMAYRIRVGRSLTRLSYERGFMVTYGLPTGTDFVLQVVNGNGLGPAVDDFSFDIDKYKGYAGRVKQDVAGLFSIGGYMYYNKEVDPDNVTSPLRNETTYLGVDAGVPVGPVELTLQWLQRTDANPDFIANPTEVVSQGLIAEAVLWPHGDDSRWYAYGLYNDFNCDVDAYDYQTITVGGGYLLQRNVRLVAEFTQDTILEKARGGIGMVLAF